jgi:hypothetical protein
LKLELALEALHDLISRCEWIENLNGQSLAILAEMQVTTEVREQAAYNRGEKFTAKAIRAELNIYRWKLLNFGKEIPVALQMRRRFGDGDDA